MLHSSWWFSLAGALIGLLATYSARRMSLRQSIASQERAEDPGEGDWESLNARGALGTDQEIGFQEGRLGASLLGLGFVGFLILSFQGWVSLGLAFMFLWGGALSLGLAALVKAPSFELKPWFNQGVAAPATALALVLVGLLFWQPIGFESTLRWEAPRFLGYALGVTAISWWLRTKALRTISQSRGSAWQIHIKRARLVDLFDSWVCILWAGIALGVIAAQDLGSSDVVIQARLAGLPVALVTLGVMVSVFGRLAGRLDRKTSPAHKKLRFQPLLVVLFALGLAGSFGLSFWLVGAVSTAHPTLWVRLWACFLLGSLLGLGLAVYGYGLRSRPKGEVHGYEGGYPPHRKSVSLIPLAGVILLVLVLFHGIERMTVAFYGLSLVGLGLLWASVLWTDLLSIAGGFIQRATADEVSLIPPDERPLSLRKNPDPIEDVLFDLRVSATVLATTCGLACYLEALRSQIISMASTSTHVPVWTKVVVDEIRARAATLDDVLLWYGLKIDNLALLVGLFVGISLWFQSRPRSGLIEPAASLALLDEGGALCDVGEVVTHEGVAAERDGVLEWSDGLKVVAPFILVTLALGPAGVLGAGVGLGVAYLVDGVEGENELLGWNPKALMVISVAVVKFTVVLAPAVAHLLGLA